MNEIGRILNEYRDDFLVGVTVTLKMTILIWIVGIVFGILLGVLSSRYPKLVGIPTKVFTFLLGGIPVLVFLYWLHYPAQTLLGIQVDGFVTTVFTLAALNTFLVADQVRNAVDGFPQEYIISGEVCGLSSFDIIKQIQIPLILRQILPSILLIQVVMMHSTLFGSLISVDEIFKVVNRINSNFEHKPVELYSTLALFFLAISLPITAAAYFLKRKFAFIK